MTDLFEKPVGLQSFEFAKLGSCEMKECLGQSVFEVPMVPVPEEHNNPAGNPKFSKVLRDVQAVLGSMRRPVAEDAKVKSDQLVMIQRLGAADVASNTGSTGATRAPIARKQTATS